MATLDEQVRAKILQISSAESADSITPGMVGEALSLMREMVNGSIVESTAERVSELEAESKVVTIGFEGVVQTSHIMKLENGSVVWNSGGNSNNRCATLEVTAGDVLYLTPYAIGSYEALPWVILDGNNEVLQSAGENLSGGSTTPVYRIDVEESGTLYVYMQSNVGIPHVKKAEATDREKEIVNSAVRTSTAFSQYPMDSTAQGSAYLANSVLERGYAVDAIFSAGNANNGVYSVPVTKGHIYKISKASLGGYGNLYWSIFNTEGIIQHEIGDNQSLASDIIVIAKVTGTLHVSYGYYDSNTGTHPKPSVYESADLDARHEGVKTSLKTLYAKTLLKESSAVNTVTGKYIMVDNGALSINNGGNTNNGYMSLSLEAGAVAKVTGACSSTYSNISWALVDDDDNVLEYSGVIGYSIVSDEFLIVAGQNATLYVGFGYYNSSTGAYPKPKIYTIDDAGACLEKHTNSISDIDKALFKKYVPFEGYSAPMIIRYGSGTSLKLDETFGNAYNRCYHVDVTAGDKYLLKKASTGGYDGVAWAIFSNGSAVQQSSRQTYANTVFDDLIIEVEQSGTLYVDNFTQHDEEICELYKLDLDEMEGNLKTKPIVCAGDSTMQGLCSLLNSSMLKRPRRIFEMAVGSENVFATAARMGAIPLLVMPFTIPAEATAVEIKATPRPLFKQTYNSDGTPATPAVQNDYVCPAFVQTSYFKCSIDGIEGAIYTSDSKQYFLRSEAGTEVTIGEPTEAVPLDVERVRNSLLMVLMGTNGGYLNYDADYNADDSQWGSQTASQRAKNLFDVMKRMFSYMGGEMVIIGFFCGESRSYFTKAFYEEYESLCEHEFGERFINGRLFLKDYAWQKLGLTLTSTDKQYMAAGYPPVQMFYDNAAVHLNTAANEVFAQYVADRISHLGY